MWLMQTFIVTLLATNTEGVQKTLQRNREEVTNKIAELDKKFENQEVPRPDFWGGFEIREAYT